MQIKQKKIDDCLQYLKKCEILALNGDHEAQNSLGAQLACGDYCLKKDEVGAIYWYAQAIKNGNIDSKWNAATMILNGEGIKKIQPTRCY